LLNPENTTVKERTVLVKDTEGSLILSILAENKLVPLKLELLEPTLEDLYVEVIT